MTELFFWFFCSFFLLLLSSSFNWFNKFSKLFSFSILTEEFKFNIGFNKMSLFNKSELIWFDGKILLLILFLSLLLCSNNFLLFIALSFFFSLFELFLFVLFIFSSFVKLWFTFKYVLAFFVEYILLVRFEWVSWPPVFGFSFSIFFVWILVKLVLFI